MYKTAIFPLFYRQIQDHQVVIGWNETIHNEFPAAECGFYNNSTGDLEFGIKLVKGEG